MRLKVLEVVFTLLYFLQDMKMKHVSNSDEHSSGDPEMYDGGPDVHKSKITQQRLTGSL